MRTNAYARYAAHLIGDEAIWEESEHPRAANGEFGSGGSHAPATKPTSRKDGHEATKVVDGKRVLGNGAPLPAHIAALKIPPAWTDVTINPDPKGELQATGKDAKGRPQAVYSAEFSAKQAAKKFARINNLNDQFASIKVENEAARKSDNPRTRAAADCALLIMTTGIRPGSETDTGADKKAFGATTLEGRHVIIDGSNVRLKFVGKKGVDLDIPVTDPETKRMLIDRKERAGDDGQLFQANEKALLDHVHSFDGGGFKSKDFRTLLGTRTAIDEISRRKPPPTDEKSYRKAVMDVARAVSKKLGNTPVIALQSYINPSVFAQWRIAA